MHEVAPLSVRAVSGRVERAARFGLVLGVPEHGAQVLVTVRELALVTVSALDLLDVLTTHFRLVPRAQRRLRRQLLLLLLLLLLFTGPSTASATTLSLTASRFRRHGTLVAAPTAATSRRRHHLLPPVFHFRSHRARSILCLQQKKKKANVLTLVNASIYNRVTNALQTSTVLHNFSRGHKG